MAYTFQTLKTNAGFKSENHSFYNDTFVTNTCNAKLKEVVEFIQITKADWPLLSDTVEWSQDQEEADLPSGFIKMVSISDQESGAFRNFQQLDRKPNAISGQDRFIWFEFGLTNTWKIGRHKKMRSETDLIYYTPLISDQATDSTLNLDWLPQHARSLIENRVAKTLLASMQRRNPILEFETEKLETDLNYWLTASARPKYVEYVPR